MLPPQNDIRLFGVPCSAAGRAVWIYLQECEALFVMDKVKMCVVCSVFVGVCVCCVVCSVFV